MRLGEGNEGACSPLIGSLITQSIYVSRVCRMRARGRGCLTAVDIFCLFVFVLSSFAVWKVGQDVEKHSSEEKAVNNQSAIPSSVALCRGGITRTRSESEYLRVAWQFVHVSRKGQKNKNENTAITQQSNQMCICSLQTRCRAKMVNTWDIKKNFSSLFTLV